MYSAHTLALLGIDPGDLASASALDQLRTTDPAAYTAFCQWKRLSEEISAARTSERKREIVAGFLRRQYSHFLSDHFPLKKIYRRLRHQTETAQRTFHELLEEYLPLELRSGVIPLPLDPDPIRLIETGLPMANGQLSFAFPAQPFFSFEARRALILGLIFFDITVKQWAGEDPRVNTENLADFLIKRGVFTGRPAHATLVSLHDPENEYRCVGIEGFTNPPPQAGLIRRKTPIRLVTLNVGGKLINVIYDARRKAPIGIARRMFADGGSHPTQVRDLYAFRFGYLDEESLLASYAVVAETVLPGSAGRFRDHFTAGGTGLQSDFRNPYSAADFRVIRHEASLGGTAFEVDHMLARTWLDILYSRAPIQHKLYHARQMCAQHPPGLFTCMLPHQIYGIDWAGADVWEKIQAHLLASLAP